MACQIISLIDLANQLILLPEPSSSIFLTTVLLYSWGCGSQNEPWTLTCLDATCLCPSWVECCFAKTRHKKYFEMEPAKGWAGVMMIRDDPWCWWCHDHDDHETQLAIWHHLAWSCMITWSHLHTCDDCAIDSSSNVLQCYSKCCCSWKSWNIIWVKNTNSLAWNKALLEIIPINSPY